jgi:hypothetical protein
VATHVAIKMVSKCKSSTNDWPNSVTKMNHTVHCLQEVLSMKKISGKDAMAEIMAYMVVLKSGE